MVNSESERKPNLKKGILVAIFVVFNAAIILWTALSEFADKENAVKFSDVNLNGWLLIPALMTFLVAISAEITKYILMMKRCCNVFDPRTAIRTFILGRYYDNITPAAVGGQPFQFMYMKKHGIKNGYSTIIPMIGMITTQVGFLLVAIPTFILLGNRISIGVLGSGCLGLMFYAVFPIGILLATFFRSTVSKIVTSFVKLLAKIHIVKDKEKSVEKAEKTIDQYVKCIKTIFKDKKLAISLILLSVVFQVFVSFIPFFVLKAFGGNIEFFTCFVTIISISSAIYFIPTPGNAGAAEGSFFFVFSSLTSGYVFWAMLFWRFFSYYSYILAGVTIYSLIAYEKRTKHYLLDDIKEKINSKRKAPKKTN
ncbi:flippase-like domain-containing protein [Candidatus Saccharibacteria bacterium]|nr:flippase-like domain-containing protein [Candidatus Saccharibacteria bacterium]